MEKEIRPQNHLKYRQNSDWISRWYKSTEHQTLHKWKLVHEEHQTTKVTSPQKRNILDENYLYSINYNSYFLSKKWTAKVTLKTKKTYTKTPVTIEAINVPRMANVTMAPKFEKKGFYEVWRKMAAIK